LSTPEKYRNYAEDVALYFEQTGLSRSAGRILGWLLVAEPPHQSMTDLVDGLKVSKSSVSTATRTLMQVGLIERISLPGVRQDYYRITEGIWKNAIQQQADQATGLRKLAEQGLKLTVDQSSEQQKQLREMRDLYAFIEEEVPILLARWEKRQK
jgi:DNA-binding transcriptional regulator GbsR (MarR family)